MPSTGENPLPIGLTFERCQLQLKHDVKRTRCIGKVQNAHCSLLLSCKLIPMHAEISGGSRTRLGKINPRWTYMDTPGRTGRRFAVDNWS